MKINHSDRRNVLYDFLFIYKATPLFIISYIINPFSRRIRVFGSFATTCAAIVWDLWSTSFCFPSGLLFIILERVFYMILRWTELELISSWNSTMALSKSFLSKKNSKENWARKYQNSYQIHQLRASSIRFWFTMILIKRFWPRKIKVYWQIVTCAGNLSILESIL